MGYYLLIYNFRTPFNFLMKSFKGTVVVASVSKESAQEAAKELPLLPWGGFDADGKDDGQHDAQTLHLLQSNCEKGRNAILKSISH
jgi:hypothetical protein